MSRGLIVSVYRRRGGDCTLGGITSTHDELTLMNASGPFEPRDERPPVVIVPGPAGDPTAFPAVQRGAEWVKAPGSWAFGGNYVATSDSRFREVTSFYGAVPVHDRDMAKETQR